MGRCYFGPFNWNDDLGDMPDLLDDDSIDVDVDELQSDEWWAGDDDTPPVRVEEVLQSVKGVKATPADDMRIHDAA